MKPILRGSKAGFTLVELIVVIAILAILAGVAIPVYSGYIEKANQAADETLLAAVNTAFAAACIENGVDMSLQPDYYASVTITEGKVAGVTRWNNAFMRYFGGNEDAAFQVYSALWFKGGVFTPATGKSTITLSNNTTLTVDNAALANLIAGNIIDNDPENRETSVNKLTNSMDTLIAKALAADSQDWLFNDEGFNQFLSGLGLTGTLTKEQRANALVLYAASKSDAINTTDIVNAMATGASLGLDDFMQSANDNGALIAKASTAYAMMYAYANSGAEIVTTTPGQEISVYRKKMDGLTTESTEADVQAWLNNQISLGNYPEGSEIDPQYNSKGQFTGAKINTPPTTSSIAASDWFTQQTEHLNGIESIDNMYNSIKNDESFQQYVAANGNADLNAFLGSMQMINDNVQSDNVQDILNNGWTEGGLAGWLIQILSENS